MRTLGVAIASLVLLMQALAGEHARLPDESLRRIFSESRKMLNGQGDLKSIGVERIVRTELGAPIAKAVDMESSDLKITLDSSSGRILAIERRPKRPRYTIDDAGSVAVIEEQPGAKRTDAQMTEEQAEHAARNLLDRLGSKAEPGRKQTYRHYDASTRLWRIEWQREINGFPLPEESVTISFDDNDQNVHLFWDRMTTKTCPTAPVIEEEKARAAAERRIKPLIPRMLGEQYAIASMGRGSLLVVYPNANFSPRGTLRGKEKASQDMGLQPRLVYSFDATFKYTGTAALAICAPPVQVWVDALTGDIVGGL